MRFCFLILSRVVESIGTIYIPTKLVLSTRFKRDYNSTYMHLYFIV